MPTLLELSAKLVGEIPGLPRLFAQQYINKAILEIRRDYLWSWNIGEGILVVPAAVSTGTASVTYGSNQVQFDTDARAVLDQLQNAIPPLIERQFRIPNGPVYNLVGYDDSTGIGTLDRIFGEQTAPNSIYVIYRCYYDPPSDDGITPNEDFLRYLTILNNVQGYTITGRRLTQPRETLNRRDPLRGAQGWPFYAFAYRPRPIVSPALTGGTTGGPSNGLMQYELWPHPTFQVNLLCQYEKAHVDLVPGDYIPFGCPETLVMYRAFEFAYRWALQNSGRQPDLKGVDWRFLLAEVQKKYMLELVTAKRNDKEVMLNIIRPGTAGLLNFLGPIDSNWAQSHGVSDLGGWI